MPLPTSKKELAYLWANKPSIAQNKEDELKSSGRKASTLPTYAHGGASSTPETARKFKRLRGALGNM